MKIHFYLANTKQAKEAFKALKKEYGQAEAEDADVIVPIGGDGTMLDCLNKYRGLKKPFYGMNIGTVGFLLNPYEVAELRERLEKADAVKICPLKMTAKTTDGKKHELLSFNEVTLFRETRRAAKIKIKVNGKERLDDPLISDGVLLSTPAGSTAYNLSAGGPIIPLGGNLLALTPLNAFRPRRWKGAQLPTNSKVRFEVVEPEFRKVRAETDAAEVQNVASADVQQSRKDCVTLLFNPDHSLEERIIREQFTP